MPLYDYECELCGEIQERFFKQEHFPPMVPCKECPGMAKKIISFQGGLKGEYPNWIDDSVRWALQTETERRNNPIKSRSDWERTLKEKDLVPVG